MEIDNRGDLSRMEYWVDGGLRRPLELQTRVLRCAPHDVAILETIRPGNPQWEEALHSVEGRVRAYGQDPTRIAEVTVQFTARQTHPYPGCCPRVRAGSRGDR